MCEAVGLPYEVVIASIREPSDFSGLPVVRKSRLSSPLLDGRNGFQMLVWAAVSRRNFDCSAAVQAAFKSGARTGSGRFVPAGRIVDSGCGEPS